MTMATGIVGEFQSLKAQTDADILAMQCGDFYEFFGDDAETVARELDLRVSEKSSGGSTYPMAGVPVTDLLPYVSRLIDRGFRVAVADQYETESGHAREIVRVITPGTMLETSNGDATYIASIVHVFQDQRFGIAFADVSTGRFLVTAISGENAIDRVTSELYRFSPVEVIPGPNLRDNPTFLDAVRDDTAAQISHPDESIFAPGAALRRIRDHFGIETLEGFGIDPDDEPVIMAVGSMLAYIEELDADILNSMSRLQRYRLEDHVILDATTQRNLELIESMTGERSGTVYETIDHTVTSAGARLLKSWLQRPKRSISILEERQSCVEALTEAPLVRENLRVTLAETYDLERLASRLTHGSADAHTLLQIRDTVRSLPNILELLAANDISGTPLEEIHANVDLERLERIGEKLRSALSESPPKTLQEGGIFKAGYDDDLDDLIDHHTECLEWIESLENREKQRLGMTHLRVDRNRTDGYFLQVGRSELEQVPPEYDRVKELKNSIRFTTTELNEHEREILRLEEDRGALEYELFVSLREEIADLAPALQDVGRTIATIDVYAGLATHAVENRWTKPELAETGAIEIDDGRHPVVEQSVEFVPNDSQLDDDRSIVIVTGPNMSGKSTYMRQVALIVLLAQIGSFVPASAARLGVVDGIFTRVGALDELARGRSTFMVEMQELSNILHTATADSLVILDEVGRGTATYDGISIAWAATEYLHNEIGAKTLFATHYHELTVLADHLDRIENVHVVADERDGEITFLRTVQDGPTDRSYGVHVADLAGVPRPVVERARIVLDRLRREKAIEAKGDRTDRTTQVVFDMEAGRMDRPTASADGGEQTPVDRSVIEALESTDLSETTPIELMGLVDEWQKRLTEDEP